MKAEDAARLHKSRKENPKLTVFDTGELLEPELEESRAKATGLTVKTGVVWFTNDESNPVLGIDAHPSQVDDDTIVLNIDTMGLAGQRIKIIVNDGVVAHFDPETEDDPMTAAKKFVRAEVATIDTENGSSEDEWDALAGIADYFGTSVGEAVLPDPDDVEPSTEEETEKIAEVVSFTPKSVPEIAEQSGLDQDRVKELLALLTEDEVESAIGYDEYNGGWVLRRG